MQVASWIKSILTVDDSVLDNKFSLTKSDQNVRNRSDGRSMTLDSDPQPRSETRLHTRTPRPIESLHKDIGVEEGYEPDLSQVDEYVSSDLERNKSYVQDVFHMPANKDLYIREFTVGKEKWPAFAVFVDGMSDKNIINTHILQPLMLLSELHDTIRQRMEIVTETLLPGNQAVLSKKWKDIVPGILAGSTAVFIDGCSSAVIVETKGWEHRTVSTAQTEVVVRGPHDAFTESFRANTGLVRAQLRSEHLVTEMMSVGKLGKTDVAIMYLHGVTNPDIVDEVKRRISEIDVDYLSDSGSLEQFLEDEPHAIVPQIMSTERPDRVAHMLTEGHVAIFVGNSPFALSVPVVLWTLVHTPEDAYLRFPYGSFLRLLRWVSLCCALLLPALYIAVTNYQPEMLPTDLMLAIAGSREQVPFPVIVEVLMMEFAIELIREAGIRIPSAIGPTIGIVGALIIGQAAVQAGIVSPLLVIVVAVTALASFTIPNYNLSMGVRMCRFLFLGAAAVFGFYGLGLAIVVFITKLAMQKSFGVPFLAPVAPSMDSSTDVLLRGTAFSQNQRPSYLQTQKPWRQQPFTRPWARRRKGRT